jgi:hypothetical protein
MILKIFLYLYFFNNIVFAVSTINCNGHDGCKNDEWIGSYDVTCNGGERICHNTVLKCGRESC